MNRLSASREFSERICATNVVRRVKALLTLRCTDIGRSGLLLLGVIVGCGAGAQVLSTVPLGIPGTEVQKKLTRVDGSTLTVGTLNEALNLVEWSAEGDTLRTRSLPARIPVIRSLVPLATGEILVSGYSDALMLDADLQFIGPSGLSGSHVIEFGGDSLLQAKEDSLFMRRTDGGIIWQQRIVRRTSYTPTTQDHHLLARTVGGFSLFSMYMDDPGTSVYVGRYSADGDFVDTVLVLGGMGPIVTSHVVVATNDGGSLFVGTFGTASPLMVRTSADGDILWIRHLPLDEWPNGITPRDVVELPDGGFAMCGNGYTWEGFSMDLLTLDDQGMPRCRLLLDPLQPWDDVYLLSSSAIERRDDGHFNVYYSPYSAGQPQQVFRSVVGDPCLSTGEQAAAVDQSFVVWPTVTHGRVNIRRDDVPGPYSVTLMDPAGRSVFKGHTSADGGFDIQHQAPGIYLMRVEGSSVLHRILLH